MFPALIAKIGLPVLLNVIGEALSSVDNAAMKSAAEALKNVNSAVKSGDISPAQIEEAHRHAEKMAEMEMAQENARIEQANQTARAEISSPDSFVRRMRPTFGYMMALTWAAQMLALAWVIVSDTSGAASVLAAMGNLSAIWAMGLSVLGIYVYKRSEEKKQGGDKEMIFWNSKK